MPINDRSSGAVVNILDACLVSGGKPVFPISVLSTGTTVVVLFASAHGFREGAVVVVSGINENALNGTFSIHVVNNTTISYIIGSSLTGAATGSFAAVTFLTHFDGANNATVFSDEASFSYGTAGTNAKISTAVSKFGGSSLLLDGLSCVTFPDSGAYNFGSGDFTVECWVYYTGGTPPNGSPKFIFGRDNIGQLRGWSLLINDNTRYLGFYGWTSNSTYVGLTDTVAFPVSQWVHVAVCRAGNTIRLFRDGAEVASSNIGATILQTSNYPMWIGAVGLYNGVTAADQYKFIGSIDEVRICKQAMYTSAFTPANSAFDLTASVGVRMAPAGWTKPYSATNTAVFKQGAGSNGMYMKVDNTAVPTTTLATVTCYESMSDISTGTNLWATTYFSQSLGGNIGTGYSYFVLATSKVVYVFMYNTVNWVFNAFGDFKSYKPGDAFNTICIGGSSGSGGTEGWSLHTSLGIVAHHFIARAHTQVVGGTACGKEAGHAQTYIGYGGGIVNYPSPIDGGIHMDAVRIVEGSSGVRGVLQGIWSSLHGSAALPVPVLGQGDFEGKTLVPHFMVPYYGGAIILEVSDTWD